MRLSQKTCLRSAYRIFGLRIDMFLKRVAAGLPAGGACDTVSVAGYIGAGRCMSRFFCPFKGKPAFSHWIGALVAKRAGVGWYPTAARRGSRPPTGSAVPDGFGLSHPSPWVPARLGVAGNRGLTAFHHSISSLRSVWHRDVNGHNGRSEYFYVEIAVRLLYNNPCKVEARSAMGLTAFGCTCHPP